MSKVLIIEDDPAYRKVYQRKFEVAGFTADTAGDGEEGLAKMSSMKPDVALVDLMMPKVDGFQFITRVKADPDLKGTPIIVLTNLSTAVDVQKVVLLGAAAVMVKSDNDPNAIVDKVKEVMAKGPSSTPAAKPETAPAPEGDSPAAGETPPTT